MPKELPVHRLDGSLEILVGDRERVCDHRGARGDKLHVDATFRNRAEHPRGNAMGVSEAFADEADQRHVRQHFNASNEAEREAIKTALSRRGVVHITIPKDIQEWDSSQTPVSGMNIAGHTGDYYAPSLPMPAQQMLERAAELINAGARVAILAGRGALDARNEVLELAEGPLCCGSAGISCVSNFRPWTCRASTPFTTSTRSTSSLRSGRQ